jgi:DNA-directed RNA polymerase specialized sigma24 family protein
MAIMLTGNRADAEDLLQAVLVKTYRSWSKINDRAALDAYVRRAMVNTHISWWRRRRLDEYPTDELPDQAVADHARESTVSRAVARLRIDAELAKDSGALSLILANAANHSIVTVPQSGAEAARALRSGRLGLLPGT